MKVTCSCSTKEVKLPLNEKIVYNNKAIQRKHQEHNL